MRLKIKSKCVTDAFDRLVLCYRLFAQDKLKISTDYGVEWRCYNIGSLSVNRVETDIKTLYVSLL